MPPYRWPTSLRQNQFVTENPTLLTRALAAIKNHPQALEGPRESLKVGLASCPKIRWSLRLLALAQALKAADQ